MTARRAARHVILSLSSLALATTVVTLEAQEPAPELDPYSDPPYVEPPVDDTLLGGDPLLDTDPTDEDVDLRGLERFVHVCRTDLGRREVTLFGNGTVRLREGPWNEQEMRLDELGPEDLRRYLGRLARIQTADTFPRRDELPAGVVGDWVERCEVRLRLPGLPPVDLELGGMDIAPLDVARLGQIADELASFTRPLDPPEALPRGYVPRPGDVLRDAEGRLFRVVNRTGDGEGVEVESVDLPLRVFHRIDELSQLFVAVEYRDPE